MPRLQVLVLILLTFSVSGCQHLQLQRRTLAQASTLTDIQYTEVLNNLAMFSANPDALPFFSSTNTGSSTNQQTGEISPSLNWAFIASAATFRFDRIIAGFRGSRTSIGQWNTVSVLNPDQLLLMRYAYQRTLGYGDEAADVRLQEFYSARPDFMLPMEPGWYCVGKRADVPRCAPYVGCYQGTYVWVKPGGENNLTLLTLAILDLSNPSTVGRGKARPEDELKYFQDQAKSLVDILSKNPEDKSDEAKELQARFESHTLTRLNALLKDEADEEGKTENQPTRSFSAGETSILEDRESVTNSQDMLIRPRTQILPHTFPPNVVPIPQ